MNIILLDTRPVWKNILDLSFLNRKKIIFANSKSTKSEAATLGKVANVKPAIEQEIRNVGDRLVAEKSSKLNVIFEQVKTAVAPDIVTEKASTEVDVAAKLAGFE